MKVKRIAVWLMALTALLAWACPALADEPVTPDFEIRQKASSNAARIMQIGKRYMRTNVNYISLESAISISVVDATSTGQGRPVEITYTTSNTGMQTSQYIRGCRSLTLTSQYWPPIRVNGSYDRNLTINGGKLSDLRLEGGVILIRDATFTGPVEARGNVDVTIENCAFENGAYIATSPTAAVTVDGVKVE